MSKSENQVFDFEKICRLCLGEKRSMSAIFTKKKSDKKVPLPVRIMSCASLELFEGDGMPTSICNKCLVTVNASYAFREQCEQADTTLRRYAAQQQEKEGKVEELDEQPQEQEYEEEDDEEREDMQQEEAEQGDSEDQTEPSPSTEDANTVYGSSTDSDEVSNGSFEDESDFEPLRDRIKTTPKKEAFEYEAPIKKPKTEILEEDMLNNLLQNSSITITLQSPKKSPPKSLTKPRTKTVAVVASKVKKYGQKLTKNTIQTSEDSDHALEEEENVSPKKKARNTYQPTNIIPDKSRWSHLEMEAVAAFEKSRERDQAMGETFKRKFMKKKKPSVSIPKPRVYKIAEYEDKFSDLGDDKVACLICKSIVNRQRFVSHYNAVHTKIIMGVCDVCGAEFGTKARLKRHLMQHNPEKPFSCEICQFSFHFDYQLKRHMGNHTDVRPHVCSCCGKAFKMNSHLRFHEEHKHNIRACIYSCETCGQGFNIWGHFQRHVGECTGVPLEVRRRKRKAQFTHEELIKFTPNKFM